MKGFTNLAAIVNLLLWQKFALLGALALAMVGVPTITIISAAKTNIDFAADELAGVPPAKALASIVQLVQQHHGLSAAWLGGNQAAAERRLAKHDEVNKAIGELDALMTDDAVKQAGIQDGAMQEALKASREGWKKLAEGVNERSLSVKDSYRGHTAQIAEWLVVMDLLADNSKLALDPDLDTYYMQRAALYSVPVLTEALGQGRAMGTGLLALAEKARPGRPGSPAATGGEADSNEASERQLMSSILEKITDRRISTVADSTKVLQARPDIAPKLDAALRAASEQTIKAMRLSKTDVVEATPLTYSSFDYNDAYTAAIDEVFKLERLMLDELAAGLNARITRLSTDALTLLAVIGALTLLASLIALVIVRSVTLPVGHLVGVMRRLQKGDSAARAKLSSRDEIGQLGQQFDRMMDERELVNAKIKKENDQLNGSVLALLQGVAKLAQRDLTSKLTVAEDVTGAVSDALNLLATETAKVLSQVNQVAHEVSEVSSQVKTQSDSVLGMSRSGRREVQEAAQELTAASLQMQEMSKLAENCNRAAQEAIGTTRTALESVGATGESIGTIRDTVRETEKRIKRLGERSQEISGVVTLINTISERTHILALNAAMHAASAGEAGRGFAVVAGEVQRLAENAREATSQISSLVHNIQVETADTVNKMNEVIAQVVQGGKLAEQAGQQMRDTEERTNHLVQMVGQIAQSSVEQARAAESVRSRTERVEKSSEITGNELEQQAKNTDALVGFAKRLVDSVSVFRLPEAEAKRAA